MTGGAAAGGVIGSAAVEAWRGRARRRRAAAIVAAEARANADRIDEAVSYHNYHPSDSGWLSRITQAVSTSAWDRHSADVGLLGGPVLFEQIEALYGAFRRHEEAWAPMWAVELRQFAQALEEHAWSRRQLRKARETRAELADIRDRLRAEQRPDTDE